LYERQIGYVPFFPPPPLLSFSLSSGLPSSFFYYARVSFLPGLPTLNFIVVIYLFSSFEDEVEGLYFFPTPRYANTLLFFFPSSFLLDRERPSNVSRLVPYPQCPLFPSQVIDPSSPATCGFVRFSFSCHRRSPSFLQAFFLVHFRWHVSVEDLLIFPCQ